MPRRLPSPSLLPHRGLAAAMVLLMLSGCIYLPRTTQVYDPQCQIVSRQAVLEVQELGGIRHCSNDGCRAFLVAAGVVTVASAVISGSLVVAGNVVYWLEKQGQCRRVE